MKKEFIKRAGQIYALGIQHGYTYDQLLRQLNTSFDFLNKKREK